MAITVKSQVYLGEFDKCECGSDVDWNNWEADPDNNGLGYYVFKCECGIIYRASPVKFKITKEIKK